MYELILIRETVFIISILGLIYVLFYTHIKDRQARKEQPTGKDIIEGVTDRLLDLADDERPIVLNVRQDKLIERTADEMERRKRERREKLRENINRRHLNDRAKGEGTNRE